MKQGLHVYPVSRILCRNYDSCWFPYYKDDQTSELFLGGRIFLTGRSRDRDDTQKQFVVHFGMLFASCAHASSDQPNVFVFVSYICIPCNVVLYVYFVCVSYMYTTVCKL